MAVRIVRRKYCVSRESRYSYQLAVVDDLQGSNSSRIGSSGVVHYLLWPARASRATPRRASSLVFVRSGL